MVREEHRMYFLTSSHIEPFNFESSIDLKITDEMGEKCELKTEKGNTWKGARPHENKNRFSLF